MGSQNKALRHRRRYHSVSAYADSNAFHCPERLSYDDLKDRQRGFAVKRGRNRQSYFIVLNISGSKLRFRFRAMLFMLREPLEVMVLHFSIPYSLHNISVICCFPAFLL